MGASFTVSERNREGDLFFIFVAAQCKQTIGFSMNPSKSDVTFAFAPIQTNPQYYFIHQSFGSLPLSYGWIVLE